MKRIRLTPTLLALALLCFFLPWIEIRCDSGTFTRTGLQLARGNWTFTSYPWYDDEPPRTSDPDWEKSDANAVVHGASLIVGICVGLFVYALPWRQVLLIASTSTALLCLGQLTRGVCADSTDEFEWEFTAWFFAAWALNAAALFAALWEFAIYVRRSRGPVGEGESSSV